LLDALTVVAASNNTTATAIFDLEAEGKLHLIFTHLPYYQVAGHWNTYLRLEVYEGIDWDAYDDVLTDLPVPQPVFQSIIPNKYYFISSIIKEFERVGKDAFSSWDNET
jgi:muconolactone delta-isomerase